MAVSHENFAKLLNKKDMLSFSYQYQIMSCWQLNFKSIHTFTDNLSPLYLIFFKLRQHSRFIAQLC